MFSLSDFLIIWCSVAIPVWAGALHLGKRIDEMTAKLESATRFTACGKKVKSKKVIHGND